MAAAAISSGASKVGAFVKHGFLVVGEGFMAAGNRTVQFLKYAGNGAYQGGIIAKNGVVAGSTVVAGWAKHAYSVVQPVASKAFTKTSAVVVSSASTGYAFAAGIVAAHPVGVALGVGVVVGGLVVGMYDRFIR